MSYSGKYKPSNPKKYKGDPTNIVYRSLWERKFMKYCDDSENILEWGSEEFFVPYKDPVTGKRRRYFPDFYIKYIDATGKMRRMVVEIKPAKQCREPDPNPPKKTKTWSGIVKSPPVDLSSCSCIILVIASCDAIGSKSCWLLARYPGIKSLTA